MDTPLSRAREEFQKTQKLRQGYVQKYSSDNWVGYYGMPSWVRLQQSAARPRSVKDLLRNYTK